MSDKLNINNEYNSILEQTLVPITWNEKTKYCPNGTTYISYKENRYSNIIAKSSSQVIIDNIDPEQNYINANNIYINYDNNLQHFIACQAPISSTMMKHWLMIWQQRSPVSIMLTDFIENNVVKADRYWPNIDKSCIFGHIKVTCLEEKDLMEKCKLRKFSIICNDIIHYHYHIHYINWIDGSIPESIDQLHSLIKFTYFYKIKGLKENSILINKPMIIHCSAGIGRTGTFITCYYIYRYIEKYLPLSLLNIKDIVLKMRLQRFGMVQTIDQYRFIYEYTYFLLNQMKFNSN